MFKQAVTPVTIYDQILVKSCFLGAYRCVGRSWPIFTLMAILGCPGGMSALLLMFAQGLVVALQTPCHDAGQIMRRAPDIPFKDAATSLRINIDILLVAFDDDFRLCITVKIGNLIVLP